MALYLDGPDTVVGFPGLAAIPPNQSISPSSNSLARGWSATIRTAPIPPGFLTISNGTTTTALQFTGTYTLADFHISNDGAGGTWLTDPPAVPGAVNNAAVSISNGEVLAIRNPHSGDVSFAGRTGTLWLDQPSSFTGTVSDFGAKTTSTCRRWPSIQKPRSDIQRRETAPAAHYPYQTASSALRSRFLANTPRQVSAFQTITMVAPWLSSSHRNQPTNRCSARLGMDENYRSCAADDGEPAPSLLRSGPRHDRPSGLVFEAQSLSPFTE